VGRPSTIPVIINGQNCDGLLDTGAVVSMVTEAVAVRLGLPVQPMEKLTDKNLIVSGVGDVSPQLLGWASVFITIPDIKGFKERHFPVLVTTGSPLYLSPHIVLGTNVLADLVNLATESELQRADGAWAQVFYSQTISAFAQAQRELKEVETRVRATKATVIGPQEQAPVRCVGTLPLLSKRAHVIVEPDYSENSVLSCKNLDCKPVYTHTEGGKGATFTVFVRNLTDRSVKIDKRTQLGSVVPALALTDVDNEDERTEGVTVTVNPEDDELVITLPDEEIVEGEPSNSTSTSEGKVSEKITPEKPAQKLTAAERIKLLPTKVDLETLKDNREVTKQDHDLVSTLWPDAHDIFSLDSNEHGKTDLLKHHIELTDKTPFKERYRRIPPNELEEVKKELKLMLEAGIVTRSNSPWSNAVVLVRKKDGSLRMCIDFRKLNGRTVKDAYPLPRITELVDHLAGARWFCALDLKWGFWQVPLDDPM